MLMYCSFLLLKSVRHTRKEDCGITKLVWVKDSPLFYTAGLDGSIRLYDARSGVLLNQMFGHSNSILDISLSA
jgi:WD40 repeat protein